jgi:hypothetical protein
LLSKYLRRRNKMTESIKRSLTSSTDKQLISKKSTPKSQKHYCCTHTTPGMLSLKNAARTLWRRPADISVKYLSQVTRHTFDKQHEGLARRMKDGGGYLAMTSHITSRSLPLEHWHENRGVSVAAVRRR